MRKSIKFFFLSIFIFSAFITVLIVIYKKKITSEINNSSGNNSKEQSQVVDKFETGDLKNLSIPSGYEISIFAENLGSIQNLAVDASGTLYGVLTDQGKVVAFKDIKKDFRSDNSVTAISGLNQPFGIDILCEKVDINVCSLYIAEADKVSKFDIDTSTSLIKGKTDLIMLPAGDANFTRSLKIVDLQGTKKLIISVPASCNTCKEDSKYRSKVLIANLDGSELKVFASGLRSSLYIAQNPKNSKIYATELGREWLGDMLPPDEVNIIEEKKFYGWPFCYGDGVLDTSVEKSQSAQDVCDGSQKPLINIPAHSRPYGLTFMSGDPDSLLIAYNGSVNRKIPTGFKIVQVKLNEDHTQVLSIKDFITGWLKEDGKEIGRPAGMVYDNQDNLFISDSLNGRVYVLKKITNQ